MRKKTGNFYHESMKNFLAKYNFKPSMMLGQNFLVDEMIVEQIADAAEITEHDTVLEIGSGIGNLTTLLSQRAKFVLGVEKDERYFPILKDILGERLESHSATPKSSANVRIVFDDILRFNFQELLDPGYVVVANIPYYITGKIVAMLLATKNRPSRIILLMQKEVAERIAAEVGELSILALSVQLYSMPTVLGFVPKEAFYPTPKVDSSILRLDILDTPKFAVDEKKFFRIIKAAFSGKRKQIHNTLKNNLHLTEEELTNLFTQTNLAPTLRPQAITLKEWVSLYNILAKKI